MTCAARNAILYDLNEGSDYYVGYAGSRISGATLADWGASENNADAKMRDGFVFDDATGLIYVPKKYTEKNKKGELKVASSRIQLLYATADKGAENSISVKISEDGVDGDVAENGTAKVDILATDTKIVLAKDKAARESLKDSSIDSVIANGIEYTRDMDMWSYDESTGTLDLKLAPAGVRTVKVKLTNDTGKTVGNFLTSIATKAFAGNVNNIGTWKFNTAPYVGMTFHTAGHNKYTGTAAGGHTMPAVENPSGGRYEAKTIYQALGTQGVDVSALQSGKIEVNFYNHESKKAHTIQVNPFAASKANKVARDAFFKRKDAEREQGKGLGAKAASARDASEKLDGQSQTAPVKDNLEH